MGELDSARHSGPDPAKHVLNFNHMDHFIEDHGLLMCLR